MAKTWVLTGSLDNFRATREHGFRVIGAKEGRRGMAEQIAPGDRIVFYVTGLQALGGIVRVTGEMYEDREKIWPGKPGKVDAYPWRFETEPEIVLDEDDFVPGRRARRAAGAHRQVAGGALAAGLPGPAPDRLRRRREAARAPHPRGRPRCGVIHARHYTLEEASELLPRVAELHRAHAGGAQPARGPARRVRRSPRRGPPTAAAPPGRIVSQGFLVLRDSMIELRELDVVLRDLDRGLLDFPSLRDGREVYLCWQEGEDAIEFWHEPDAGFGGRRPLDDG